jgi:hypothetical protein
MWHPSNSPYFASKTTLTNPPVSPIAAAFPEAEKGNLPTFNSKPASLAASSVYPTDAICGRQYVQPGTFL